MVDHRSETADYPIESVEVPFDGGKTISCLFIAAGLTQGTGRDLRPRHGL
jgi:hypothetical protein